MNLKNYSEKVEDFFTVEGLKANWAVFAVLAIFGLGLWLRYMPEQGMRYLQALDPYMIFKNAQHLAYQGSIPPADFTQYFPYNAPFYLHNNGDIIFPAIFWWAGGQFLFSNFLEWGQFYPALMGAFSTVAMYFFGKEVLDKRVGVAAAFFLAVIPGVMRRSSAGFFEKEPIGTFFMMLTLYFFTRAWNREEYIAGMLSGVSLAFFTISWGGSKMLWLLLPLVVGSVMFIDEDIQKLIVAYTPTVLIGGGVAAALNYNKFWITGPLFIGNLGLLGLLWTRNLVEEFELMEEGNLKYFTPSISILGLVAFALSPLYSNFLASKWFSIINMATQSTSSGVIGGTVAENTAPGLGSLLSSLGALMAGQIHFSLNILSNITGAWPLMLLGVGFLATSVTFMLLKKFDVIEEEISDYIYFGGLQAVFVAWSLVIISFFMNSVMFGIGIAGLVLTLFVLFISYLEEESAFKLFTMISGSMLGLEILLFVGGSQIAYALVPSTVMILGGVLFLYYNDLFDSREIELNWMYLLPLAWILTNLLGAVAKSRLIFLSSFSVAFAAGYGLNKVIKGVENLELDEVADLDDFASIKYAMIVLVVGLVFLVNGAAGFVSVQGIGGSPSNAWYTSLNYMDNQSEPGSTIMSWWDYGYHFESIGRRPSIANGWNAGYYSDEVRATNMPLADFLTSSNPRETPGLKNFLEQHSVDYIVLDNTMIGKYSAVSTISNGAAQLPNETEGQPTSMITLSTSANIRNSLSQSGNLTTVQFSGRGLSVYAPVEVSNTSIDFSGSPTLQTRNGARLPISCVLTENGTKTFDVNSRTGYCLAEDPYYSLARGFSTNQLPSRAVLVPQEIADSTIVELYLEDGTNLDWVEKVPEGSNDYLKMWKVTE